VADLDPRGVRPDKRSTGKTHRLRHAPTAIAFYTKVEIRRMLANPITSAREPSRDAPSPEDLAPSKDGLVRTNVTVRGYADYIAIRYTGTAARVESYTEEEGYIPSNPSEGNQGWVKPPNLPRHSESVHSGSKAESDTSDEHDWGEGSQDPLWGI
jgi:hypothetical protein